MYEIYESKYPCLKERRYGELRSEALRIYSVVRKRTRRKPYVRSAYFKKQKVFLYYFWPHLFQKHPYERRIRLKYYEAALDLLRNTRHDPITQQNPDNKQEVLHRFRGKTKDGKLFYVQVKENKRTKHLHFMSCFPARK